MLWKEIRPQTSYRIRASRPIAESEMRVLSHLYAPLIQSSSFALYMFLYHQVTPDLWHSEEFSHRLLMDGLGMDLKQLVEARERLEGVGLLSTYRISGDGGYEYVLHPPLTPYEFFQSEVLSLFLLNRLGLVAYRKIREQYSLPAKWRFQEYEEKAEITMDFSTVFSRIKLSEFTPSSQSETERFLQEIEEEHPLPKLISDAPANTPHYELDFEYLEALFSKEDRPYLFADANKDLMKKYAFLYGLDVEDLGKLLKDTYTSGKKIWDIGRFESLIKMWYKAKAQDAVMPITESTGYIRPLNKEEHLKHLKSTTPYKLLLNYQNGGTLSTPDKELIDLLIEDIGLVPEVVNVLLDYVLLITDNKLPRSYIEKIASSWKRKGFKTAEEAFEYAQKEYEKSIKGYRSQKKTEHTLKRKVPEYIWVQVEKDRKELKSDMPNTTETTDQDVEEVKKLIKEFNRERGLS